MTKKKLKAVLALLLSMNLAGCSFFEVNDDSKKEEDKSDEKKIDNKDSKKKEETTTKEEELVQEEKSHPTVQQTNPRKKEAAKNNNNHTYTKPNQIVKSENKPVVDTKPLPEVIRVDFSVLKSLLTQVKNLDTTGYTPKSIEQLNRAIRISEALLNDRSASQSAVDLQVRILMSAWQGLTRISDFTELNKIIKETNSLNEVLYTPASFEMLKLSLVEVNAVAANMNSTQSEVDKATEKLRKAINQLVTRANTSKLTIAINDAKAINNNAYTDVSLEKMNISLDTAIKTVANLNATQKQVDKAAEDLKNDIESLVAYVAPDLTPLKSLLVQASKLKENEYSITSFATLSVAIKTANDTLVIKKVTQEQVDSAKVALDNAMKGLTVDTSKLEKKLEVAKGLEETTYTPSTFTKLKTEITNTELFLQSTHKQYEINEQLSKLDIVIQQLVEKANKSDLKKEMDTAKTLYAGDYTKATMDALKEAVNNAQRIYEDEEATQETVSEATQAVKQAISKMKLVIHKENLQKSIDQGKAIVEIEYTPSSYEKFKVRYDEAMLVNNDEEATQEQVDSAHQLLTDALSNLVKRANIVALSSKITEGNLLVIDDYTDDSFNAMKAELLVASELVKNLNVSQEAIDQQFTKLDHAIKALIVYVAPNFTDIHLAIQNAKAVNSEHWSITSYQTMSTKLKNAEDAVAKKKVTQEEIDQAKTELIASYNALSVDKTILNEKLVVAKTYMEVNYTLDTFANLQTAITHTTTFLGETHNQKEVNAELVALQAAISNLVIFNEADKGLLTTTIAVANAVDSNLYTPDSYAPLENAILLATTVKNNYRATVQEINDAINGMNVSKASLIKRADLSVITATITMAEGKYTGAYTSGSIQTLKDIVASAQTLMSNLNASQSTIDSKVLELNNAINNLIKLGDKTALSNLIDELNGLKEVDYTPSSWTSAMLGTTINEAMAIRDKTEATETEVNSALDNLTLAKAKLVKKADITELTNEITKAEIEATKGYTTVTLNALTIAIGEAKTVSTNQNATASEVSMTLTKLKNALSSLRVDVTPLINEINISKAIDTTNKKPSTVTVLKTVITEAESYKDSSSVTFDGMNTMIQKLKDAVKALEDGTDIALLQEKIVSAKALNKDDYTPESYATLLTVITEAEQAILNENITALEVTTMIAKIDDAINGLKYPATVVSKRKECDDKLVEAQTLLDSGLDTPEQYRAKLKDDIRRISGVFANYDPSIFTVSELQGFVDQLNLSIKNFKDNALDRNALIVRAQAKIAEVRAMDLSGYSSGSAFEVTYYTDMLEERIKNNDTYQNIEIVIGWIDDEIADLEPKDTNTYVNAEAPGEVLALLNAERKAQGLTELVMDTKLCEATTIRATEAQYQTGPFADWAHKRPDGRGWSTVLDEINYHQGYAGENAARGIGTGKALYDGWYNSPGHKENMMNPNYTKIGISMIKVGEGTWVSYMILAR